MNRLEQWHQSNEAYLAAAMEWLRLRLQRMAEAGTRAKRRSPSSAGKKRSAGRLWKRSQPSEPAASATKTVAATPDDKATARAAVAMAEAEAAEPPPAMMIIADRFGLTRFERQVLLLCAAMELDTRIPGLCARAQDDLNRPYPTLALALTLLDEPAWDLLSPERPLRFWRLLEIHQAPAQPLTSSPLRADDRIVSYLKGLNYLDERITPLLAPLTELEPDTSLPPSQEQAAKAVVWRIRRAAGTSQPAVVQLLGPDSLSKQLVARQAAIWLELNLYRLPAELLPTSNEELEILARIWQRESRLLPLALFIDTDDSDKATASEPTTQQGISRLRRFLARSNGLFFLDSREVQPNLGDPALAVDVSRPTPAEQQQAWTAALGGHQDANVSDLASQFNLDLATIQKVAGTVTAGNDDSDESASQELWSACLAATRPRLDTLAQRLDPKATWDDIVLPAEQTELLHEVAHQVRHRSKVYDEWGFRTVMNRGLGISALFAGDSGTGKTMAAEVIANALHLNLYRIDLSAVVNKYIGETEKNLRRLFDAAEDGGAILLFDEADALFGKRSEVKDSHDRYANIEINYLLQRLEAYSGLAILATNMKSALDHAFLRRLRFIVRFPFPGAKERSLIWEKAFPAQTPAQDLDFNHLARLNITGGSIHNIAVNAAFLAAQSGTPITMPLLLASARTELRKLERPINEADLRWQAK
jgi:hypothetical protein